MGRPKLYSVVVRTVDTKRMSFLYLRFDVKNTFALVWGLLCLTRYGAFAFSER